MKVRQWIALATLVAGVLAPDAAAAQQPSPRQREPLGFDFRPNGVWRPKARTVAAARRAALVRGDFQLLNSAISGARRERGGGLRPFESALLLAAGAAQAAVMDTLRVPALLVQYATPPSYALQASVMYDSALFTATPLTGRPYNVRTYYEEISNGLFSVQGASVGWLTMPQSESFYAGTCSGLGSSCANMVQLIRDAVAAADASVDFRQYDNDGPDGVPNSADDDGIVDLLYLIHPSIGAECGRSSSIWAHRFFVSGWGTGTLTTQDGVRIEDYTVQSGVGGGVCLDTTQVLPPGTVAHETGHGLNLPDFYDTNPTDGDDSEGIGEWGLMGSGNYTKLLSPAHMESFSLSQLGWIALRPITTRGTYTLGPIQTGDTAFVIRVPAGVTNTRNEYFLLENRQSLQSDTGLFSASFSPPRFKRPGLLIWHVDSLQYDSCVFSNCVNTGPIHGLWLMQADGMDQLRSSVFGQANRGDEGDPYPGATANTVFGVNTSPSSSLNLTGRPFAGFVLDSIRQLVPNGEMTFRARFGALTIVRASDTTVQVRVRGSSYRVYRELLDDGDTATIAIESLTTASGGRTQYVFASWSDGQPRQHAIVGAAAGGTITANLAVQHQVSVATVGSGTVSTTPTVPVSPGAFLNAGASLTLTATPAADQAFIGWSGDTTVMTPTLTLPMQRPYALTATFVPLATLVSQFLLGGNSLTAAQILALDQNGNRNNALDLGDLVAWLDSSGAQLSAELMRRILARMVP